MRLACYTDGMATDDSGRGLNGASHGASGDDAADDDQGEVYEEITLTEVETAAPPEAVAELVAACVRFAGSKYGVALDFSPESLAIVDQYVRDSRGDVTVQAENALPLVAGAVGAYLGEVVRRHFGGYWFAEGEWEGWRLMLSRAYLAFNPVGMALEALTVADVEGWGTHLVLDPGEAEAVAARLAVLPQVDEEEYFAPSTRFEVVELAFEAIRRKMHDAHTSDVVFTPEDYA